MSWSDLARLGSGSQSGARRTYVSKHGQGPNATWHSALVGPRDPLDLVKTECGVRMERPVLLESYPFGRMCITCGSRRVLASR